MEDIYKQDIDKLLVTAPGGIAKIAYDDIMTILYMTDNFYSLIKNVADKAASKTPLALLHIVYSTDIIYVTSQVASQKHRKDNMFSIKFRVLQHDGSFKWVMITGNKTEETYQQGSRLAPVYSCMAMDVTDHMVSYKNLEQKITYMNKINELSRDLYFEYEIATDTLSFNEMFREIFGKDNIIEGFRSRLEKTDTIHPDERPSINTIYNSMMRGRKLARFELRLIPKDGVPCWYICYAAIIFDENRNPYKAVGKLSTTNHVTSEAEHTSNKPLIDALTNVCTRESMEAFISEVLKKQEADTLSALFLLDIRNYKVLNDVRKSIDGENILTGVGKILKKHFRTSDIIGRQGLSEFVIYMKNIPSDDVVYDTAEKLCKEIEGIYSYAYAKSGLTVSMGIVLHRGGQEYSMLMNNANAALVMAKKSSGSSFEIYSGVNN